MNGPYDQFLLFGDSLTQQSCSQAEGFAFAPALQDGMTILSIFVAKSLFQKSIKPLSVQFTGCHILIINRSFQLSLDG